MRLRPYAPQLIAVAAAFALAACSSGGGPSAGPAAPQTGAASSPADAGTTAPAGTFDPCSMLTQAQVDDALGVKAAAGSPEPDFDAPECEWDAADGTSNGNVTLDVGPWDGDPGVKPANPGTPVSGIGDEAYDNGNTGLYVRKGANGIRIWVFNVTTQTSRLDLEKKLAAVLLPQI